MQQKQIKLGLQILLVGGLLWAVSALPISRADDETATQHKETLQQVYKSAVKATDLAQLDTIYAPEYVNHGFGDDLDLSGFKAVLTAWHDAMPDFTITPEVIIADADHEWAASRVIFSGTFDHDWQLDDQKIAPNFMPVKISFNILHRFNDTGKIVEDFTAFDKLDMLIQMGAAPELPDYIKNTLVTGEIVPIVFDEPVSVGMEKAHKEGYARVIDDSLNKGDLSAIDTYMIEDYLTHEPFGNFTRENFKTVVKIFRTVVPDLHVSMDITVTEGDWLAGRLVYTGTFGQKISQDGVTIEATGKPILFVINVFVRFNKDGIGIADYKQYNRLGWLQQLGLLPAPTT